MQIIVQIVFSDEPNNANKNEDCVVINHKKLLNDLHCGLNEKFICQPVNSNSVTATRSYKHHATATPDTAKGYCSKTFSEVGLLLWPCKKRCV